MAGAGKGSSSILRHFTEGAKIEISSDDEGFRGSWYLGTVIKAPKRESSMVKVEYETLIEEEAGTRKLRESVKLVQLRPRPPREDRLVFNFSDEVDAYHNDGWWEGVITKVLAGGKYAVFFRGTREQLQFTADQLRLHREWVYEDDMWVPPVDSSLAPDRKSTQGVNKEVTEHMEANKEVTEHMEANKAKTRHMEANKEVTEHIFNPGDLVEASSNESGFEDAWFEAKVLEKTTAGKYLVEYQKLRNDDDTGLLREEVDKVYLRPPPPDIGTVDSFILDEKVDASYNDGWWTGVISKILKNDRYAVFFETSDEEIKFEHGDLRVHQEWRDCKWFWSCTNEKRRSPSC